MSFMNPLRISKLTSLIVLTGLGGLTAWHTAALAASQPLAVQTVIETRKTGLKKMGAAMKAMSTQLKSGAPDSTVMTTAAQAISTGAQLQPEWFPAGSGPESGVETDALAHIWKDRAKFDSLTNQLIAESKKLTTVIGGNDTAAIGAQMKVVGEVCGACHRSFRAD